jgi:hypothetical protein
MDPVKQLARALAGTRAKAEGRQAALYGAELGTITATGLKLDRFKHEIRKYLVSHHLTLDEPYHTVVEPDTGHHGHGPSGSPDVSDHEHPASEGAHNHRVVNPNPLLPLHPGDRVLVIPVNEGREFVVVARVVVHGA